jgi:7-carboxy-7-deazaguanine synthase
MPKLIRVSEIFYTLQGEGALVGKPTVFVRTGGCDYECHWCDTLYAVLPAYRHEWQPMTPEAIVEAVLRLTNGHAVLVTLSGGNPALQPLGPLLELGRRRDLSFALETQGSQARPWFARLDYLVLSPKPPSSGMATAWDAVAACRAAAGPGTHVSLKVVVFDEADYQFAREAHQRFPDVPCYLQIGTPPGEPNAAPDVADLTARLEWLLGRVASDGWHEVTLLPQLHVLLWGHKRGV